MISAGGSDSVVTTKALVTVSPGNAVWGISRVLNQH